MHFAFVQGAPERDWSEDPFCVLAQVHIAPRKWAGFHMLMVMVDRRPEDLLQPSPPATFDCPSSPVCGSVDPPNW